MFSRRQETRCRAAGVAGGVRAKLNTSPFIVVTNNYRAAGGGNFPGLDGKSIVLDSPDENREALVQYLASAGRLDPSADNNWRIQPVPGVIIPGAALASET